MGFLRQRFEELFDLVATEALATRCPSDDCAARVQQPTLEHREVAGATREDCTHRLLRVSASDQGDTDPDPSAKTKDSKSMETKIR